MGLPTILMFVVMIGLIWFMQRQQKKQAQERQNQLNAIEKGDEIVTIGGMFAVVDEVDLAAKRIVLDVDGVYLPFELSAIKRVVEKGSAVTSADVNMTETVVEDTAVEASDEAESAIETD
ncbi:TPA: preprotein translocase subunit YajC [Streptococcus equi subsp. zooepidemicus]|uniref:Preprotein translocase subunit YajC n=1 Tax=Streptococcus equi subsp. equi TaxID=148942 RepID=A0A380JUG3_9STRE|nr:preprotein translocase subunit YajC [Streptococcus equi]SUN49233.1 preprotein translocase subunit YajC [Streptococcus equi subsp. equi]HEK9097545.1 preprotein translocase subunit YajC [Streptococcus equi subsp. zooepidemicus]HEK9997357.1 preprotein translocase subunit YajC [Streptococcus equi subsp. zooepidemicus]HEL0522865.1 preprotein translocase subunit YajC [Streptococcus equi subsp. zooepidemicus]HEL0562485.1 preprotein translocase subunit YajC [Streptococcus equi subsp. zooepidemicus]